MFGNEIGDGDFKSYGRLVGVELARAGNWNGNDVTDEMLGRIIDNYDPKKLTATVTYGHPPRSDDGIPASGTVERLYWKDGPNGRVVCGDIDFVPVWALSDIQDNRWVYPSIVVNKGWTQLYNVGILGAATPGIEGLARLSEAVIEFSKANQDELQAVACRSGEEKMSHEKDDVTKKEKLTLVAKIARALGFSLKSGEGDEIDLQEDDNAAETLAFKKQLADSETARKKAEDELAAFRKSEAEAVAKAVFARAAADVEALIKEGFMTPAAKDAGVVEAFALLAGLDGKVKFSSAEGKEDEKAPYELMLAAFRSQVPHELKKTFAKNDAAEQPTTDETKCAAFDTARTAFKKEHGREATIAELQEIVGRIVSPEGGQ